MSNKHFVLSTLKPTLGQRHRAFGLALLLICSGLLALPFLSTQATRFDALILIVDTALVIVCFLVAVLLYTQVSLTGSRALRALGGGFLFVALTTLPQLMRVSQGAFVDLQLGFLSDLALPVAVILYALFTRSEPYAADVTKGSSALVGRSVVATVAIAALAIWLAAATDPGAASRDFTGSIATLDLVATALLVLSCGAAITFLWSRDSSLDLWLLVTLTASLIEVLLQGLAPDGAAFARLYGLVGALSLLLALLAGSHPAGEPQREGRRAGYSAGTGQRVDALRAIADELNQPLFAITANADAIAQLMAREPPDIRELRAAAADISVDAQRASRIIGAAQRLLTGAHEPPAVIDVGQLVNECMLHLETEMFTHRVVCAVETAPQLPGIRGFRRPLLQMLINLVTNSLEAMSGVHADERRLTVRALRHDSRTVAISVEDSGIGIQPADLERVFDPYFTTKPHRSGLGLAICRSIVDAHGGDIFVAQGEGRGTAFKVILPVSS